ncbi:MAG: MBL fold metallo-hydrolase [Hyphomonadaceae bacterium]|nr:MBL fold metallo-hydrolase [Hyphomonadaceae bacterium]
MRTWLIGVAVVLAALGGFGWYALLDAAPPARADGVVDIAAYRALVAGDAPEALPTEVRVEIIAESDMPSFAAEAGAFDGPRTFAFPAFEVVAPGGAVVIDAALDRLTLDEMTSGEGQFNDDAYQRLLDAIARAAHVLITHEHLDHVMAISRHPAPEAIAPRLRLTRPQLDALPEHAPNGQLAPAIADVAAVDLAQPTRISPGVVAAALPGHSLGTVAIYVRTTAREYLFIGDIVWQMSNIENLRGRPRLVGWMVSGVDPDRQAVLRQIRALHDLAAAEPRLAIVAAHDAPHLRALIAQGAFTEGFSAAAQGNSPVESVPPP